MSKPFKNRDKDKGRVNWNEWINDLMRPQNRKLLFTYIAIFVVFVIFILSFFGSMWFLFLIFGYLFGYPILKKIFRKKSI